LIKEDIEAEKRFGGLRDRMDTIDRAVRDLIKAGRVTSDIEDGKEVITDGHGILWNWISALRGWISRGR